MDSEFVNRLGMFHTALGTLDGHKTVWDAKPPVILTTKVGQAKQATKELDDFCQQHSSDLRGVTMDKKREEKEAAAVTASFTRLLVQWFVDNDDLTNAAKVDVPLRGFSNLRDQEEVAKLREVRDLGKAVVEGDKATQAAEYGITADAVATVDKEVEEYAAVVNAPQSSISQRAALTKQLRQRFNAVEDKFTALDNLIQGFSGTPEGRALIVAFQASRIIRDLDGGHKTTTTTTPATP